MSCGSGHLTQTQPHAGILTCRQKGARRRMPCLPRVGVSGAPCRLRTPEGGAACGPCSRGARERVREVSPWQASSGPAGRTGGSFRPQLNKPPGFPPFWKSHVQVHTHNTAWLCFRKNETERGRKGIEERAGSVPPATSGHASLL